jgi:hypothetical protein
MTGASGRGRLFSSAGLGLGLGLGAGGGGVLPPLLFCSFLAYKGSCVRIKKFKRGFLCNTCVGA